MRTFKLWNNKGNHKRINTIDSIVYNNITLIFRYGFKCKPLKKLSKSFNRCVKREKVSAKSSQRYDCNLMSPVIFLNASLNYEMQDFFY